MDALLKQQFRPEFLKRLDDIIYYKPLMKTEIYKIVDLMLAELGKRLEDKRLSIEVTDAAKEAIVNQGYDQNFGARPLKRFIQRRIETLIAKKIIADELEPDSILQVDYDKDFVVNVIYNTVTEE